VYEGGKALGTRSRQYGSESGAVSGGEGAGGEAGEKVGSQRRGKGGAWERAWTLKNEYKKKQRGKTKEKRVSGGLCSAHRRRHDKDERGGVSERNTILDS